MNGADEIFTTGPETLIAKSAIVIAGAVSNYRKRVTEYSADSSAIPLRWITSGEIAYPTVLKGRPLESPVRFTRLEQVVFIPRAEPLSAWARAYGEFQPKDHAVIFLEGSRTPQILMVLPSGEGERDMISLAKDIVKIQVSETSAAQTAVLWRKCLSSAWSDEGRRAALRSLVAIPMDWNEFQPALDELMASPKTGNNLRSFVFGIVSYGVIHEKWADAGKPLDFLGRRLSAERNADLAVGYLQHVKLLLRFANDEDFRDVRKPLREQLLSCVKQQSSRPEPDVAEECRAILVRDAR